MINGDLVSMFERKSPVKVQREGHCNASTQTILFRLFFSKTTLLKGDGSFPGNIFIDEKVVERDERDQLCCHLPVT